MKRRTLIISDQAREDLTEIWLYIAANSPLAADRFVDYLHEKCNGLCSSPQIGRDRRELLPGIRCLSVKRYLIFYRVTEQSIEIARILILLRQIAFMARCKTDMLSGLIIKSPLAPLFQRGG